MKKTVEMRASVDKGPLCYTVDLPWIAMTILHQLVMRLKGWYMKTLIALVWNGITKLYLDFRGAQGKTIGGVYVSIAFLLRIHQDFYALRKFWVSCFLPHFLIVQCSVSLSKCICLLSISKLLFFAQLLLLQWRKVNCLC